MRTPHASLYVIAILGVLACKPQQGPVAPVPTPQGVRAPEAEPQPIATSPDRPKPIQGPAATLSPEADELRRRGLAAMDAGRFDEAQRMFRDVLERHPENAATKALMEAATKALAEARSAAGTRLTNVPATRMPRPPFRATLRRKAPVSRQGPKPKIVKISSARNSITDDAAWLRKHDVRLPLFEVPNRFRRTQGNLPPWVPKSYGTNQLVQAIAHPDHTILLFGPDFSGGRFIAVLDREHNLSALLDFESYVSPPGFLAGDRQFVDEHAQWAEVRDNVLYVSHFHRTYAKSSKRQNAYITAIDLRSHDLLWRSAPLVANSRNFLLRDGYIITGYGFTAEPDFLYILDQTDGKQVARAKLKTGPDYIFEKNGRLLVRTYDTNYVFELR